MLAQTAANKAQPVLISVRSSGNVDVISPDTGKEEDIKHHTHQHVERNENPKLGTPRTTGEIITTQERTLQRADDAACRLVICTSGSDISLQFSHNLLLLTQISQLRHGLPIQSILFPSVNPVIRTTTLRTV